MGGGSRPPCDFLCVKDVGEQYDCRSSEKNTTLRCLHTISSYNRFLWYKQSQGGQLQLLGYMWGSRPTLEANVSATLDGSADENKNCTLTIEKLQQDSSAVYFCAASLHSVIYGSCSAQKPHHHI
uniref:Immunoglobulin V-set domain-containing protein n=1 Tax=Oreochromis niloticus TaxID=8128 RepID=A0A669BCQ7_ORENI